MVAAGVAVALGVDGGLLPGLGLAVLGLLVKGTGFLLGDPSSAPQPGRGPQTLAGRRVERPRAGIPVGRANVRRRVPGRTPPPASTSALPSREPPARPPVVGA